MIAVVVTCTGLFGQLGKVASHPTPERSLSMWSNVWHQLEWRSLRHNILHQLLVSLLRVHEPANVVRSACPPIITFKNARLALNSAWKG